MNDIAVIIASYLMGSIPFGLLIARLYGVPDIRKVGSGNTGATNVLRTIGVVPALLSTILDIGKGTAAVIIAIYFGDGLFSEPEYLKFLAGLAAILGHIFPVFLRFKGGKGVNTALGVFVALLTIPTLIALGIFIIVVSISRYVSLGSILAAVSLPIILILFRIFGVENFHNIYFVVTTILALLILVTHRSNIKRLFSGTENKISFRKKPAPEVSNSV